jgi:cytochrome P450
LPRADFALPWDDAGAPEPVDALARARATLGDSFVVESGRDTYVFVFSPAAVRDFYALPEAVASKGLADYRMLVRKLPDELFAGPRTFAHDLFGAQDVETYLGHLEHALDLELATFGDSGTVDAFAFARRVGHRLGLACWLGDAAAAPPAFDRLVAELDRLDGADAFVHPERMAAHDRSAEQAALARVELLVGELMAQGNTGEFLAEIARRWDDVDEPARTQGIARDVVLLHIATMTNLFAALGWTLAQVARHPEILAAVVGGDDRLLERCAFESVRIGQRSIMMRSVLKRCAVDGLTLEPGTILATMLPLTNLSAAPGLDTYDPDRWEGRRLRDEASLPARELVTTFGHGPHRCPAQRFSLSAIGRTVRRLTDEFALEAQFDHVRALPAQIGGVGRAADPCPLTFTRRRRAAPNSPTATPA